MARAGASPSPVALGKRPALTPRTMLAAQLGATRDFSWNPFGGKPAPVEAAPAPVPEVAAPETAAAISTPLPASDTPAVPAEHAVTAPSHHTSTAPDHQFHSDPSALLPQSPANAATPTLEDLITNSGLPLEQVLASPEAVHAAMKVSDLKLMGLDHGFLSISGWLRDALVGMHSITGLPWWASIIALTLTMRMTLFPLLVRTTKHNVRMQAVSPQFQGIMKRMKDSQAAGDQMGMALAQQNLRALMKEHDVSPFRGMILPLVSMPLFISLFFGLRKLAALPLPQLHEGGFGWVLDLTLPDPLFILPVTSLAFQILVFGMGADSPAASSQRTMAHFRNFFIASSPLMLFFVAKMPAAVLFYWTTSNMFTALQAWTIRQPVVKRILGIPTPKAVPPPPEDVELDPNPSIKDTFHAMIDWQKGMMDKARERQAAAAAAQNLGRERIRTVDPARPGAEHKSTVRENYAQTRTAGFLEGAKAEADAQDRATRRISPEEAKRQRVEEARRKRRGQ
jgi:YidC/Oxa1 family membrane protein insertase